jgi:hypothetical protein
VIRPRDPGDHQQGEAHNDRRAHDSPATRTGASQCDLHLRCLGASASGAQLAGVTLTITSSPC